MLKVGQRVKCKITGAKGTITQIRKRPRKPDQLQIKIKSDNSFPGFFDGGKYDWWQFASYYQPIEEET